MSGLGQYLVALVQLNTTLVNVNTAKRVLVPVTNGTVASTASLARSEARFLTRTRVVAGISQVDDARGVLATGLVPARVKVVTIVSVALPSGLVAAAVKTGRDVDANGI